MEHARLHKTLTQLQRWPTEELEALASALETLLAERTREAEVPLPVKPGRAVVETRQAGRETLRREYIRCGKEGCRCASEQGHGPYWYAYRKEGRRVVSRYIGKALPDALATPDAPGLIPHAAELPPPGDLSWTGRACRSGDARTR